MNTAITTKATKKRAKDGTTEEQPVQSEASNSRHCCHPEPLVPKRKGPKNAKKKKTPISFGQSQEPEPKSALATEEMNNCEVNEKKSSEESQATVAPKPRRAPVQKVAGRRRKVMTKKRPLSPMSLIAENLKEGSSSGEVAKAKKDLVASVLVEFVRTELETLMNKKL